jgi:hypothetical protein
VFSKLLERRATWAYLCLFVRVFKNKHVKEMCPLWCLTL